MAEGGGNRRLEGLRALGHRLQAAAARRSVLWRRLIVAAVVFLIVAGAGLEFSSQPRFCVTCHYMRPYYDDWKRSTHNMVPCVDCHFPPGVRPAIERKFQTIVQVAKYVTRQYGTRPWTEIQDASCLRPGCHETRLLPGPVDFHGVAFDHGPHLSGYRRVTQLRCTACHSQIVIGTHMTVTDTSCFLCHFKFDHAAEAERMSDCQLCHKDVPTQTPAAEGGFDHAPILQRGVSCEECHSDVTVGNGFVPEGNCLKCHAEPERLLLYKQATNPAAREHDEAIRSLHRNHVTDHKIECTQCHQEITHRLPPTATVVSAPFNCATCHPNQHEESRELYYGLQVGEVAGKPDAMAAARVSCLSCHRTHVKTAKGSVVMQGGAAGCMNCHGEVYGRTLAVWKANATAQVAFVEQALDRAQGELGRARGEASKREQAKQKLATAAKHLHTVRAGGGVHNVAYAEKLLASARARINEAMVLVGSRYRAPPLPKLEVGKGSGACLDCHTQPPSQPIKVFGTEFSHGQHIARLNLTCATCHRNGEPQDPSHGALILGRDGCRLCHERSRLTKPHPSGWETTHSRASRQELASCSVCHSDRYCLTCHVFPMPHPPAWTQKHGGMALGSPQVCARCHTPKECITCHGVEIPHPDNWASQKHLPVARTNSSVCLRCHTEQECTDCHGLTMPHPPTWTKAHGAQADRAPRVCAKCHAASDCQVCHREARLWPTNHKAADWRQTHAAAGALNQALCELCHGPDPCDTCHGLPMPHPENYLLEGHMASKPELLLPGSLCYKCHEQEYCGTCHPAQ